MSTTGAWLIARLGSEVAELECERNEARRARLHAEGALQKAKAATARVERRAEKLRQRLEEARREASYLGELAGLVEVELVVGDEPESTEELTGHAWWCRAGDDGHVCTCRAEAVRG